MCRIVFVLSTLAVLSEMAGSYCIVCVALRCMMQCVAFIHFVSRHETPINKTDGLGRHAGGCAPKRRFQTKDAVEFICDVRFVAKACFQ